MGIGAASAFGERAGAGGKKKAGGMFAGLRDLEDGEDVDAVDTQVLKQQSSEDDEEEDMDIVEQNAVDAYIAQQQAKLDPKPVPNDQTNMHLSNAWQKGGSLEQEPERIRILSCDELLDLIAKKTPAPLRAGEKKVTIGFVGYPNVGKSSTLNALVGAKKVTVSSTPGKTKHFQTIHLDESTILCDCPGLVFPSFATTKAEMVCNGVLPIDQLREHTGPATLVAQRIPRHALQAIYGIRIRTFDQEGNLDPHAPIKGEQLCAAYAVNRGFKKSGQGNPDEARAARIILKEYVMGKLLYCHPPPGNYDPVDFNIETYSGPEFFPKKKRAKTHEVAGEPMEVDGEEEEEDDEELDDEEEDEHDITRADEANINRSLDSNFFKAKSNSSGVNMKGKFQSTGFTRSKLYPHQVGAVASAGETVVVKGKGKAKAVALPTAVPGMGFGLDDAKSKKHKKEKRGKVRVNWTKDERND
ncbi:hypothetical protein HDU99_007244 [Rhizoclosmatium hyalinum]|nr:hypothetical protein HDU99_007244 [Rhizoclosmatium hyalinum]